MMDPSWDLKRWHKNVHTVDSPVTESKDVMNFAYQLENIHLDAMKWLMK